MHYEAEEKVFVLDGDDRLAIGVPSELGIWPVEDIGHLFEEITFAPHRIADLQEWYPEKSAEWIAKERTRRFDILARMREVLVVHGFATIDPDGFTESKEQNT